MKDTFYFSHDYNARSDIKIKKLIAKHGYLGYGIFWGIIEDLYNNANALPLDYYCIASEYRTNEAVIDSIINDFDLFVINNDIFGSLSVQRRLNERNEKSMKARESANNRWKKYERNTNALQTQSDSNAIKEIKGKEKKVFTPPTILEVKEFFKEKGYYEITAQKMFDSYSVANWHDSKGNKIKNWKQKAINVWFTDENKINNNEHLELKSIQILREMIKECNTKREVEKLTYFAEIIKNSKELKYKFIDCGLKTLLECFELAGIFITNWELDFKEQILKYDNKDSSKSISTIINKIKNRYV